MAGYVTQKQQSICIKAPPGMDFPPNRKECQQLASNSSCENYTHWLACPEILGWLEAEYQLTGITWILFCRLLVLILMHCGWEMSLFILQQHTGYNRCITSGNIVIIYCLVLTQTKNIHGKKLESKGSQSLP